jgi:hypothetical protein
MFGDSGRWVVGEGRVFCAPADATDPAAATVAVLRKSLRSMKGSSQGRFVHASAVEAAENSESIELVWRRPLLIFGVLKISFIEFTS